MNNIEQKLWVQVYLEFITELERMLGTLSSEECLELSQYNIADMVDFLETGR